jgi:anti-sigma B factor antagonist
MNFDTYIRGDVIVEIVNLDRATMRESEEFKEIMFKHIDEGFKRFVVDLNNCNFIDSTFLSTLVSAYKKILSLEGDLKLASVHDELRSLIELTGTRKVFKIYSSANNAIKSYE